MPKVSIIIPTYNVEQYLNECMDSVTRQTLHDIEIICINDGSTDGSLAILESYAAKDDRIVIVDKENGGYGIGMNIGLDRATGEYIGIVEPDDFIPLNMYEDLYAKAVEHDLDFVKADFYRFSRGENGDMSLKYYHLSNNPEDYNKVFCPTEEPQTLRYIMNTWSGIYRRSFLNEYHIRHNETPGASFQDNGFYFQTFAFGRRAMILDRPYYMNRRDNPNSSVNDKRKIYCINVEYDYIRGILTQDQALWERFKAMYWYKKYSNYWACIKRIAEEAKPEYIRRFAAEFQRGFATFEIDRSVFTEKELANIDGIIADPDAFYKNKIRVKQPKGGFGASSPTGKGAGSAGSRDAARQTVKGSAGKDSSSSSQGQALASESAVKVNTASRVEQLEREVQELRASNSYRLGHAILYLPGKIKYALKGK